MAYRIVPFRVMFKVDLPTANFLNAISDADLFAETMKFN